jgi:hypothetical protein
LTVHRTYLLVSLNARRYNDFEYCIFCFNNVYSPFCKISFVSQGKSHCQPEDPNCLNGVCIRGFCLNPDGFCSKNIESKCLSRVGNPCARPGFSCPWGLTCVPNNCGRCHCTCVDTTPKHDAPVFVNVNCGGKGSHSGSHSGSWSSDEV